MNKAKKSGAGRVGRRVTEPAVGVFTTPASMDRLREAVQALKDKYAAHPDYEYDIFVSYIHGSIFQDWLYRVMAVLESWLTLELGRRPLVFYDSRLEMGKAWHQELAHALQTSRYLVPFLSPGYFQSRWSTAEWQSFIEREKQVGVELVFPICVHEGSGYPDEARQKKWLDLTKYFSTLPGYWNTPAALELEEKLRAFARDLGVRIKEAPPFRPDFPVLASDLPPESSSLDAQGHRRL